MHFIHINFDELGDFLCCVLSIGFLFDGVAGGQIQCVTVIMYT